MAVFGVLSGESSFAATTWTVQNCNDTGSGSLRDIVTNSAQSGDTVDLSGLPGKCAMPASTITLSSGQIIANQTALSLQGPTPGTGSVTVAGSADRVFNHAGTGTFSITSLTIADGAYTNAAGTAYGGCIKSAGTVFLSGSIVTGCTATGLGVTKGGGIYSKGGLVLFRSALTGNLAESTSLHSAGGGGYTLGNAEIKYSTVDNDTAKSPHALAGQFSNAGGIYANGSATIINSTISRNTAYQFGGLYAKSADITNSTISGNSATANGAAVFLRASSTIYNSTIAFNVGDYALSLSASGPSATLTLQSTIVAKNGTTDVGLFQGATLSGTQNIIGSAKVPIPPNNSSVDPQLGPLQWNGGRTETHALLPGSPAIGKGNDTSGATTDQRGRGYPRTTGLGATVDIGAFQFDSIFADDFEG